MEKLKLHTKEQKLNGKALKRTVTHYKKLPGEALTAGSEGNTLP
jgi:hypothetical protein